MILGNCVDHYEHFCEIVELLLEHTEVPRVFKQQLLTRCIQHNRIWFFERLLREKDVDVNYKLEMPALIVASRAGKLEIVNRLLRMRNVNVNARDFAGNNALYAACQTARERVIRRLLKEDDLMGDIQEAAAGSGGGASCIHAVIAADIRFKDVIVFRCRCMRNCKNYVRVQQKYTGRANKGRIVRMLLDDERFDANALARSRDGEADEETPLFAATRYGLGDVVWELLCHPRVDGGFHRGVDRGFLHHAARFLDADTLRKVLLDSRLLEVRRLGGR